MPIYEYECAKCGERVEVKLTWDAPDGIDCTKCGGTAKRVVSPFTFILAQPNSKVMPGARPVRR